jgi:terminase, large subunit
MNIAPYTATPDTFFLPSALPQSVVPVHIPLAWSKAERKVLRKKKSLPTSIWAEKNRILTSKDSNREGGWKNSVTPYLVGPMDAAFFPSVREMVLCKPPQTGGSEAINNIVGKIIDQEPGQVLYIYPNEKDAKKNIRRRVLTMIRSSACLSSYLTGYKDDEASALINLSHMMIRAGWAGSPQSLASTPERYVIFEEPDKYPEIKKEADSISLGKKRARTYRGREKIFYVSSPSTEAGPIWQALLDCEVIFEYVVVCPHCLDHHSMDMGTRESQGGLKWPEDERDHNLIESKELAWFQCWHCQAKWDDYTRDKAVTHGYWRQKTVDGDGLELFNHLKKHRPKKIGFQYNAMISTFVSLSQYASAFLKGSKNRNALKDFLNGYAAEPWTEFVGKERRIETIQVLKDENAIEAVVPSWALVLILTADVQKYGIWYELRAWNNDRTSQLIRHGFLAKGLVAGEHQMADDFGALKAVALALHKTADGIEYKVRFGLVDSGYRTDEVYEFCRVFPTCAPAKGQNAKVSPITTKKIDTFPGTGRLIPGGVTLVSFDTTIYKDTLSRRLQVNVSDPGAWILHNNTDDGYCYQYTAEIKDEEIGLWVQRGSQDNHLWDCGVLQLVALEILEKQQIINQLATARETQKQPRPPTSSPQTPSRHRLW